MDELLALIAEIQAIGESGEFYGHDEFDIERYQRIRAISAQMAAIVLDKPLEPVRDVFLADFGYQTPKVDSRAAIFDGDKILLVQERDGRWSMPGGWIDVGLSVRENTVKEAQEEAGLDVRTERLIAVFDKTKRRQVRPLFSVYGFFVECTVLGGEFRPNIETRDARYFGIDELPELSRGKTNEEQIAMCFEAHRSPDWQVYFD